MATSARRRRRLAAGLVGIGSYVVATQLPANAASTVSIDAATTFQKIDGLGVAEAFGQADSNETR